MKYDQQQEYAITNMSIICKRWKKCRQQAKLPIDRSYDEFNSKRIIRPLELGLVFVKQSEMIGRSMTYHLFSNECKRVSGGKCDWKGRLGGRVAARLMPHIRAVFDRRVCEMAERDSERESHL